MAPAYKLTYFDLSALGEPVRFLMHYGNIEFEDVRFSSEQWPTLKPTLPLPYGQVPILEHDGKVAHQSLALSRYFAKKAKLVGNDDWENLEIDAAVDTINDFRHKIVAYHYETDPEVKERKKGPLFGETLGFYVEKFEAQVKKNNGYFAVGRLTWADFYFASLVPYLNHMLETDFTKNAPGLKAINEKIRAIPQIKAYIEKSTGPF